MARRIFDGQPVDALGFRAVQVAEYPREFATYTDVIFQGYFNREADRLPDRSHIWVFPGFVFGVLTDMVENETFGVFVRFHFPHHEFAFVQHR